MTAILYKKRKKITQSGPGTKQAWILSYNEPEAEFIEPVMGWNGTRSTNDQIQLEFPDIDSAKKYAKLNNIELSQISTPKAQTADFNKSYIDNFK